MFPENGRSDVPAQDDAAVVRETVALHLVKDAPVVVPDEKAPVGPRMFVRVAEAVTAVLADGEWHWVVAVDRLAALGLSHHDSMIARAKRHLAERGRPIERELRPTDGGAQSWWRMPAQMALEPPGSRNSDEKPPAKGPVEQEFERRVRRRSVRPPLSVVLAIARAVDRAGGDLEDAEDLVQTWERVQVCSELRADAMRREARTRECCCANRPEPGRDGRCPVCFGRPTQTNTKEREP